MRREIDELILLDIAATERGSPDFELLRELCSPVDDQISTAPPITYGGGIRSLEHIQQALRSGADKTAIGTYAIERPSFVRDASEKFGAQCAVVSVDCRQGRAWSHCGTKEANLDAVAWCEGLEALGCGEVLLTDADLDGTCDGYNLSLIAKVSSALSVPVIAAGGCGGYLDMAKAFDHGASAVCAAAAWSFLDCTPAGAAEFLHSKGYPVRRKLAA